MENNVKILSASAEQIIVGLTGDVDASVSEQFDSVIQDCYLAHGTDVVLDCSALDFIDSTILGAIVKLFKQLKADGHRLVIKDLKPRIKKLFEICALDSVLEFA